MASIPKILTAQRSFVAGEPNPTLARADDNAAFKRGARHASCKSASLQRLRHFRVVNHELAGIAAVIGHAEHSADAQFEALCRDIVKNG